MKALIGFIVFCVIVIGYVLIRVVKYGTVMFICFVPCYLVDGFSMRDPLDAGLAFMCTAAAFLVCSTIRDESKKRAAKKLKSWGFIS